MCLCLLCSKPPCQMLFNAGEKHLFRSINSNFCWILKKHSFLAAGPNSTAKCGAICELKLGAMATSQRQDKVLPSSHNTPLQMAHLVSLHIDVLIQMLLLLFSDFTPIRLCSPPLFLPNHLSPLRSICPRLSHEGDRKTLRYPDAFHYKNTFQKN